MFSPRFTTVTAGLVAACALSGCGPVPEATATADDGHRSDRHALSAEVTADLLELRRATGRFQDFEAARSAGYSTEVTECFQEAEGGMGFHYGRTELIDGQVSLTEPELLMYEPQDDGSMALLGVEYVIPLDVWAGDQPPRLLGQQFHVNERFGLWVLHVWAWSHNPNGIFADWNPLVSCRAAART
jgi:hypothetical protein